MKEYSLKITLSFSLLLFGVMACSSGSGSEVVNNGSNPETYEEEGPYTVVNDADKYILTYGGSGDDRFNSIIIDANGDFIIVGKTESYGLGTCFNPDAWILKLNPQGEVLWQKTYGGSYSNWVSHILITPEGNYLVAGRTEITPLQNNYNAWVFQLDEQGNVLWEKTYDGWINDIQLAPDGGYIVVGNFASEAFGNYACLLKLDEQGEVLWQNNAGIGGLPKSVKSISGEGYIISGLSYSKNLDFNPDDYIPHEAWLCKLDLNGEMIWQKQYSFGSRDNNARDVYLTSDGGFLLIGENGWYEDVLSDCLPLTTPCIVKLDENGELVWKTESSIVRDYDYIFSMEFTDQKSFIISGSSWDSKEFKIYGRISLISSEGSIIWDKKYPLGTETYLFKIIKNPKGGYIVVGGNKTSDLITHNGLILFLDDEGNCIDPGTL